MSMNECAMEIRFNLVYMDSGEMFWILTARICEMDEGKGILKCLERLTDVEHFWEIVMYSYFLYLWVPSITSFPCFSLFFVTNP